MRAALVFASAQPQPNANEWPRISEPRLNACSGDHKEGDHLTCYVHFDGDPKFNSVNFSFSLDGSPAADQVGLPIAFTVGDMRKLGDGVYAVDGVITSCASGTYQMKKVTVGINDVGGRNYSFPGDFLDVIKVQVKNNEANLFPAIKDVSAKPLKAKEASAERPRL